MAGRRIIYLTSLIGCLVFYYFYREWLSWLFLMAILFLPWLSLIFSLPAMITARGKLDFPDTVPVGQKLHAAMDLTAKLPVPSFRYKLRITNTITGTRRKIKPGKPLPTDVCGRLIVEPVVENCFKHGMNTTEDAGWIRMSLVDEGETVCVEIENNGNDLTDEELSALRASLEKPAADASFTGLVNTHHRLKLFYGSSAGVEVQRGARGGLLVRLRITRHPIGILAEKEAARHDFSGTHRR